MKIRDCAIAATILLAMATVVTTPAAAGNLHLRLTKSAPAENAALSESPTEIRLWFSQETELSISRIVVTAADGTEIELGKVEAAEENALVVAMVDVLSAGTYEVAWRTSSGDGHPIRGTFGFTVTTTE